MAHSDDRLADMARRIYEGDLDINTVIGVLSTSEQCCLALAASRPDLLTRYPTIKEAWQRMDDGQRAVVLTAWNG